MKSILIVLNNLLYKILIVTALIDVNIIYGFVVPDNDKCRYVRVEKMLKARCHGMNLRDVPQYLGSGIEVLDLSYNRIKKLKKSSFQRYRSIRYLLLYDNMIHTIETGTFTNLHSLEEIDLSNNALLTIPLELFNLPSLRNLYVDSNELINLHQDLKYLEKPIKAPLEYLNIADCGLNDIPYFGILPRLWHFNASLNPLDQINIQKLSPFCHLKSIDLDKTKMPYCSCQLILMYLSMRKIKSHNNFCDTIRNVDNVFCQDTTNITVFNEDYDNCTATVITTKLQIRWMYIAVSTGIGFIFLIGIILWINKRKSKKNRKNNLSTRKPIINKSKITNDNNCGDQKLLKDPL